MTKCEELGCANIRYDNILGRDVCDEKWPRPEDCPLNQEETQDTD